MSSIGILRRVEPHLWFVTFTNHGGFSQKNAAPLVEFVGLHWGEGDGGFEAPVNFFFLYLLRLRRSTKAPNVSRQTVAGSGTAAM